MKKEETILVLLFSFFPITSFTNYLSRPSGLARLLYKWPLKARMWRIAPAFYNIQVEDEINEGNNKILPGSELARTASNNDNTAVAGGTKHKSIFGG